MAAFPSMASSCQCDEAGGFAAVIDARCDDVLR
jgi:hypothetical protein